MDLQTGMSAISPKRYGKPYLDRLSQGYQAFYMRLNEDGKPLPPWLLVRSGEIVGGSQREERYDLLLSHKEMGLEEEEYKWYMT